MTQRSDDLYLVDIVEAADAIKAYLSEFDERQFLEHEAIRSAVLWKLYIVAEAASRLSSSARNTGDSATWDQVKAFRNRMAHGYFTIEPQRIWQISQESLPELARYADTILAQRYPETHAALTKRR